MKIFYDLAMMVEEDMDTRLVRLDIQWNGEEHSYKAYAVYRNGVEYSISAEGSMKRLKGKRGGDKYDC